MDRVTEAGERLVARIRGRARPLALILAASAALIAARRATPGVVERVRIHLAVRAIAQGRLDDAADGLDLVISEAPMCPWPKLLRARVAREQGSITEAEELLQRAVELGLPVEQARVEHDLLARAAGAGLEDEARR